MSTEIALIKGTYHVHPSKGTFEVEHIEAELQLTRFYNGKDRGRALQLTVSQQGLEGTTSYIQLTPESCKQLAQILLNAFDDTKHPSE